MQVDNWTRRRHVIEHVFEAPEGSVPDLQDGRTTRRMVIRPRTLTIHQLPDTSLARWVTIEGRQVRRDGELAGVKMILVGLAPDLAEPPGWVNSILHELGLDWMTARPAPAP